jgi:hypothetical protein
VILEFDKEFMSNMRRIEFEDLMWGFGLYKGMIIFNGMGYTRYGLFMSSLSDGEEKVELGKEFKMCTIDYLLSHMRDEIII